MRAYTDRGVRETSGGLSEALTLVTRRRSALQAQRDQQRR